MKAQAVRSAHDLRIMRLLKYFLPAFDAEGRGGRAAVAGPSSAAHALSRCVPVRVPWSAVALHVMHEHVPPSQMLHAFNATVVGLACEPRRLVAVAAPAGSAPVTSMEAAPVAFADLPRFLSDPPLLPCVGLGIVATVDPEAREFRVITPLSPAELAPVNVLLKGTVDVPPVMAFRAGCIADPYLAAESLAAVGSGAGGMKSRNTIKRKRHGGK